MANYPEMEKTTMPRTVDCARIVGMIATLQALSDKGSSSQALYSWIRKSEVGNLEVDAKCDSIGVLEKPH